MTCQLEPLEGLEAATLPRLIHIQVVAGEAGEYDIVYSLPKEGRYIFTINIFHWNRGHRRRPSQGWKEITTICESHYCCCPKSKHCNFSDTRCGSECMAVTSKIVLSRYQSEPFDGHCIQNQVTCLPDEEVRRGVRSYSGSLPRPRTSGGRQVIQIM